MKKKPIDDFDAEDDQLSASDYSEMFKESKKELLLEKSRARVTTMSFHDWFTKTYKRDFKPSDKHISEAYHAGAGDEIENNEYVIEHAELKMNHYKARAIKLADQVQILYALLESVTRKAEMPETLKKLVRKVLSEQ
jgi:hypothetical protein